MSLQWALLGLGSRYALEAQGQGARWRITRDEDPRYPRRPYRLTAGGIILRRFATLAAAQRNAERREAQR